MFDPCDERVIVWPGFKDPCKSGLDPIRISLLTTAVEDCGHKLHSQLATTVQLTRCCVHAYNSLNIPTLSCRRTYSYWSLHCLPYLAPLYQFEPYYLFYSSSFICHPWPSIHTMHTTTVVSAGICHRNKVNSIAWLYRRAQPKDSILLHYITLHYITCSTWLL